MRDVRNYLTFFNDIVRDKLKSLEHDIYSDIHFTQEFKEHLNIMFVQLNADYKTFSLYLFYMVGIRKSMTIL